jgi:hypothetical protein
VRKGGGGLLDRDDNLEVGARLLGRRCKDLVGGSVIAKPYTPYLSVTEANVGHVFVGEQNFANLARGDPSRDPLLGRQHRLQRARGDDYGRRVSLDRGRLVASLATQEAEDDYSDKGRASPHTYPTEASRRLFRPGVMPERLRKAAAGSLGDLLRAQIGCADRGQELLLATNLGRVQASSQPRLSCGVPFRAP